MARLWQATPISTTICDSDYVLWLDADERVTPELKQSILQAVENNEQNTVYQVSRLSEVFWSSNHTFRLGILIMLLRLYRQDFAQYGDELVHEKVHYPKNAQVKKLKGDLLHFTYKVFTIT